MKIQSGCIIWFGNTIIYWIILLLTGIHVISGFCHIRTFSMWKLLLSPSQLLCDKNWILAVFGQSGDTIPVAESVRPWSKSWAYRPPAVWPWTSHLTFLSLSFFIWKMREIVPSQGITKRANGTLCAEGSAQRQAWSRCYPPGATILPVPSKDALQLQPGCEFSEGKAVLFIFGR